MSAVAARLPACLAALLLAGLAPSAAGAPEREEGARVPHGRVVFQALDKVTARVSELEVAVGEEARFGSLRFRPLACFETPPTEAPESAVFVEIDDAPADQPAERVFTGWMYASSPAISALEHAVYDLWVLDCEENLAEDETAAESPADSAGTANSTEPTN